MKKLALAVAVPSLLLSSFSSYALNNIVLYYSGPTKVNTKELPEIFRSACDCNGGCKPTTTVPVNNAVTGNF